MFRRTRDSRRSLRFSFSVSKKDQRSSLIFLDKVLTWLLGKRERTLIRAMMSNSFMSHLSYHYLKTMSYHSA